MDGLKWFKNGARCLLPVVVKTSLSETETCPSEIEAETETTPSKTEKTTPSETKTSNIRDWDKTRDFSE